METIYKSAWIHVVDQKMLFLRSKGKDIFYLPGGKRETGESNEAALVREIKEETSVDLLPGSIRLIKNFSVAAHGRENTFVEVSGFYADYEGDITPSSEIEEIGWFDTSDKDRVPSAGQIILDWLKEQALIN